MTEQTDKPLTHLSLSASNRSAREYVNLAAEGLLWLDAPYQRGSVWTEAQQRGLVKSWKLGIPIPAVIVNDRNNPRWAERNGYDARYVVIDGKQRITAAIAWFTGELAVPASWFEPDHIEATVDTDDGTYVTYTGLTLKGQRLFANRALIPVVEAKVATVAEEAAIYLLVNTAGTAQSAEDLGRAANIADQS